MFENQRNFSMKKHKPTPPPKNKDHLINCAALLETGCGPLGKENAQKGYSMCIFHQIDPTPENILAGYCSFYR